MLAEFLAQGNGPTNNPKLVRKSFSHTEEKVSYQQGGNRLTGAGNPQKVVPSDVAKIAVLESAWKAPMTQEKIGHQGVGASRNVSSHTYNQAKRALAGSSSAGVSAHVQTHANTLIVQRNSRASARGVRAVNTTSSRGGSSQTGRLKAIAGTVDTFQLGGGKTTGTTTVKVASQHFVGLHRIINVHTVMQNVNRVGGHITTGSIPPVHKVGR